MAKDIRVALIEDDPYARDLMSLLLTRDWRTRVVGEVANRAELLDFLAQPEGRVNVVVLDTEIPDAPDLPFELAALTEDLPDPPAILFTGTQVAPRPYNYIVEHQRGGYVLKNELLYALGSAIAQIAAGHCVITPGVQTLRTQTDLPTESYVLDGRRQWSAFTPREREIIRLAMIFNLAIRDMADELVLSAGWISEIVSTIYMKLGLREILTGEAALEDYFSNENVLAHCREITQRGKSGDDNTKLRKAPWMTTLAFHLLTIPEIKKI